MPLLTKIQYRNFEPGEFTDKKERTYEETIRLIEHFPWEEQRDHLAVDLTNPSITLEDTEGNFLKLALYYGGKFVLHYFNTNKRLYTKSLLHVEDAYPYIRSFFDTNPFDTVDFRLETSWIQGKAIHFKDQDFQYRLNPVKCWIQMALYTAFLFFYLTILAGLLISSPGAKWIGIPIMVFMFFLVFLVVLVLIMAVLFNHYRAARGKILILSKGNDIFYYGDENNPEQYDKKDITGLIVVGPRSSRSQSITYISIEMGLTIGYLNIPNMLINTTQLLNKLSGYPQIRKKKQFPFIPSSSSTPS